MANYLPAPCCEIYELFLAGKISEAEALSEKIILLNQGAAGKYGVAGVKASLDLFGYKGGEVRNPLSDCSPSEINEIKQSFIDAGYL
jgi:4-hydroxy-2-oxoglutarate aldolase